MNSLSLITIIVASLSNFVGSNPFGLEDISGAAQATKEAAEKGSESLSKLSSKERVRNLLKRTPMLDDHNDVPFNLRRVLYNDLSDFDFNSNIKEDKDWQKVGETHTDLPRMKTGGIGIQFWSAFTKCRSQYLDSVEQTLEQIDVIKRLSHKFKDHLYYASSTKEIEEALKAGKIASLIGVEGGHSIQMSLGILRSLYELGARYLTLTHNCHTPWADSHLADNETSGVEPVSNGLSDFGKKVIKEMNRLGMMVDLSHTSVATQRKALEISKAPVIFSHSGAYGVCPHGRNVKDDILEIIKEKDGIVMLNMFAIFVRCDESGTRANMEDVIAHLEHIRKVASVNNIGFGADYDGVPTDDVPIGMEDVSKYPDLLAALLDTGRWTEADLEKIMSKNLLRVFAQVEKVRDNLKAKGEGPYDGMITRKELEEGKANTTAITAMYPGDEKNPEIQL